MQNYSATPREIAANLWRNRSLIKAPVKREALGRDRSSFLGILGSFFNRFFMLKVYTFVFSVIYKARWSACCDSKTEFALVAFTGMIVFNLFAEYIGRARGLIVGHQNYVNKVVFLLEVLPWDEGIFRTCRRYGDFDAPPRNILGAVLGRPLLQRPTVDISPGLSFHFHHLGFNYRVLEHTLQERLQLRKKWFSPFTLQGAAFNSEVYFLLRNTQPALAADAPL